MKKKNSHQYGLREGEATAVNIFKAISPKQFVVREGEAPAEPLHRWLGRSLALPMVFNAIVFAKLFTADPQLPIKDGDAYYGRIDGDEIDIESNFIEKERSQLVLATKSHRAHQKLERLLWSCRTRTLICFLCFLQQTDSLICPIARKATTMEAEPRKQFFQGSLGTRGNECILRN